MINPRFCRCGHPQAAHDLPYVSPSSAPGDPVGYACEIMGCRCRRFDNMHTDAGLTQRDMVLFSAGLCIGLFAGAAAAFLVAS